MDELDMRFAFERDMVRHSGSVFTARDGIIGLCEVCGEDFDKVRSNQKVCSDQCRREKKRTYDLKYWNETGSDKRTERQEPTEVTTPDNWTNLMLAIAQQAAEEKDTEWLEKNKVLYTTAILGVNYYDDTEEETKQPYRGRNRELDRGRE